MNRITVSVGNDALETLDDVVDDSSLPPENRSAALRFVLEDVDVDELRRYAGLSGFSSAEMWWGGIVDTHGLVPPDGALYRVSLVPSCPRCGQVLSGWAAEDGTLPLGHFSRGCGD